MVRQPNPSLEKKTHFLETDSSSFEFSAPNLSPTKHLEVLNQSAPNIAHVSQGSFTRGIVQRHMTLCILGVKIYMTPSVTYTTTDVESFHQQKGQSNELKLAYFLGQLCHDLYNGSKNLFCFVFCMNLLLLVCEWLTSDSTHISQGIQLVALCSAT